MSCLLSKMSTKLTVCLLILLGWSSMLVTGYNILVFMPYGSHSHKATMIPLIKGLAERNHSVTFITNQESAELRPYKEAYDLEEVVVANLTYSMMDPNSGGDSNNFFRMAAKPSLTWQLKLFRHLSGLVDQVIERTYLDPGVQQVLESPSRKFDLLLLSQVVSYAGYPLAWHFQCPFILSSPNVMMTDSAYLLGDSEHTEYVPFFLSSLTDRMTLPQRLLNTVLTHGLNMYQNWFVFPRIQPRIDRFFPNSPPLSELKTNISAAFANTHPALSYPREMPPGAVELGAIHCRPARLLPRYMEEFISKSGPDGFIVFGVGSIIRMDEMPVEMISVFVRVFARLKQQVIWQWKGFGGSKPANLTDNVMLVDWLPQQDLLGHDKCRAFITHGGLLSTQEAVYHAVPVLGLPFVNDQRLNMDKAVRDGYAIRLGWDQIQEQRLYRAINQLVYNGTYVQRVRQLSSLLHDQPETPLERGLYWIEYIARHGGAPHLKPASTLLNRFQRSSLDVYLILVLAASVLLLAAWRLLSRLVNASESISTFWKLELD